MTTPRRGLLFHITHIDNLRSIIEHGLLCDGSSDPAMLPHKEIGKSSIKEGRDSRNVPVSPFGVVSDYVPFYFAARSPMLYTIHEGNIEEFQGSQDDIVHLVTSVESVAASEHAFVVTDRNAYYPYADFTNDLSRIDEFIDWELMESKWWGKTIDEPDRVERRMAEFLVYRFLPVTALIGIGTRTQAVAERVEVLLTSLDVNIKVGVRPGWYY